MSQQDQKSPDQKEKVQRPKTLLTDEEMAERDIAFVELIKARTKLIEKAKRAKGIIPSND